MGSYFTAQGELVADSYVYYPYATWMKFNIGNIPAGKTIGSCLLNMNCNAEAGTIGSIDVFYVETQDMGEADDVTTLKAYPTGTSVSLANPWTGSGVIASIEIKDIFLNSYTPGSQYLTIKLRSTDDSTEGLNGKGSSSREKIGTDANSRREFLNRSSSSEYPYLKIYFDATQSGSLQSESISVNDFMRSVANYDREQNENISVSDYETHKIDMKREKTETLSISDSVNTAFVKQQSLSETLSLNDYVSANIGSAVPTSWSPGSIVFTPYTYITTKNIYLGVDSISNIGITLYGSGLSNLGIEATADGTHWEDVSSGSVDKYFFTNKGSSLKLRFTETKGNTAILTKYKAEYGW